MNAIKLFNIFYKRLYFNNISIIYITNIIRFLNFPPIPKLISWKALCFGGRVPSPI